MTTFCAKNLNCWYGKTQIIKNVSFDIESGQFCGLIGLNGCGKSTLIKALCGLIPITTGLCSINGKDYLKFNEKKRAKYISYIPQRYSSIYGRTALDVVMMGFNAEMTLFGKYSVNQKKFAILTLERIGIKELADNLYEELSEGQKQLVILARTIVQDTPVIVMDEPDSALDFTNKNRILAAVRDLLKKEGKSGLIALHDPNAALSFCDRLLLMKDGQIIHNLSRNEFKDYKKLEVALSDIFGKVKIIDNNGTPVMVGKTGVADGL